MDGQIPRLWLARFLIAAVIAWNLQAALVFWLSPETFAPGFELSSVPGTAVMRGIAVLFLMWNVPYVVACWHPQKHNLALKEALAMQSIGLLGESWIYLSLSAEHALLQGSILRFISFDGAGLALLVIAFVLARQKK
jgi:hypothetical protein